MSSIFGNMSEFGAEPQKEKPVVPSNAHQSNSKQDREEYVLVKLDACYADEFDVCHAWVMTREEYNQGVKTSKENLDKRGRYVEIYFGTNEALNVDDFDDYMRNLSVETISKEDYDAFNRMFGSSFGMCDYYFPYGD